MVWWGEVGRQRCRWRAGLERFREAVNAVLKWPKAFDFSLGMCVLHQTWAVWAALQYYGCGSEGSSGISCLQPLISKTVGRKTEWLVKTTNLCC